MGEAVSIQTEAEPTLVHPLQGDLGLVACGSERMASANGCGLLVERLLAYHAGSCASVRPSTPAKVVVVAGWVMTESADVRRMAPAPVAGAEKRVRERSTKQLAAYQRSRFIHFGATYNETIFRRGGTGALHYLH